MKPHPIARKSRLSRVSTYAGIGLAVAFSLGSAGVAKPAKAPATPTVSAAPVKAHWYQIGRASWYGGGFQGHATASGENYNMTDLTCAHRSLPLGTLVRVTNLVNHRSVVVRVTDRGPYLASRIVDLSYAAAQFLGFSGTEKVRLEVLNHATELADVQSPLPVMGR